MNDNETIIMEKKLEIMRSLRDLNRECKNADSIIKKLQIVRDMSSLIRGIPNLDGETDICLITLETTISGIIEVEMIKLVDAYLARR